MKNGLFLIIVILFTFEFKASAVPSKESLTKNYSNTVIRVLLEKASKSSRVTSIFKENFIKFDGTKSWVRYPKEITLRLSGQAKVPKLILNDAIIEPKGMIIRGGPHHSDKIQYRSEIYRGALKVSENQNGFTVTNILELDDYLAGTLAAEMNASWELEALKAQAVASRTYALYMMKHPKHSEFDLDSTTQDQVYAGVQGETARTRQALKETEGLFLSSNKLPIKSYFHSRCGGMTETANAVWNYNNIHLKKRVPCPYCQKFPYSWTASVTKSELFKTIPLTPLSTLAALSNLSAEKTPAGRVSALRFSLNGHETRITSDVLRGLLGYSRIKSARFDWKVDGDEIQFEGVGSGHGVGMCQWGARYLAKQGKNFKEILAHYYPGIAISHL